MRPSQSRAALSPTPCTSTTAGASLGPRSTTYACPPKTGSASIAISITTINVAPTLTTISTLPGATEDTPFTIDYATLLAASDAADGDGDPILFRVEAVSTGTLTKGGIAVIPGTTTLGTGESLVWTPDTDVNGVLDAFTVVASDGLLDSGTPVQVTVDVAPANDAPTLTTIDTFAFATLQDQPFNITYATLLAASDAADVDGDTILFQIQSVQSGTLTKDGDAVVPGTTTLGPGETLVWTPTGIYGTLNAFRVRAYDGALTSAFDVQVRIQVAALPTPYKAKKATPIVDDDGDLYTVSLKGFGTVGIFIDDPDQDGKGPIELITATSTDGASIITVTVKRAKTGDGLVSIGGVQGDTIGSIVAVASDLVGPGITLTGYLGSLTLHDILNGADIDTDGHPSLTTYIKAHVVDDGTDITTTTRLDLYVASYGLGQITAPTMKNLTTKGDKKIFNTGDFQADITLTDALAVRSIEDINIAGEVACIWTFPGGADDISFNSTADTFDTLFGGDVNSLSVKNDLHGTWESNSIKNLNVKGSIIDALITLNQAPLAGKPALGELTVKYWITGSQILVAGNINKATVGGMEDSNLFAGVDGSVIGLPDPTADFVSEATISRFTLKGIKVGKVYVDSFINSNIAASILGVPTPIGKKPIYGIVLAYAQTDNAFTPFGLAANTLYYTRYFDAVNGTLLWPDDAGAWPIDDFTISVA